MNAINSVRMVASPLLLISLTVSGALPETLPDLSLQIAEVMSRGPSGRAHQRFAHAKGIVCEGSFTATPEAALISRAAHFTGEAIPVTVRFSDGAPDAGVADNSPDAAPRGMAIRFAAGRGTDIVALAHNGFIVGNGEDFLALQIALAATDQSTSHPWPIEEFLAQHPRAMKFVKDKKPVPVSFTTEAFFGNNAFIFVNADGGKQAGRYHIIPADGTQYLSDADASAKSPNFLRDELSGRLARTPARFRLLLQLAGPEDTTSDSSIVWPASRKMVEMGIITIASVVSDSAAAERKLAFDPTRLINGIELSDDPLPPLRSRVYALSVANRTTH